MGSINQGILKELSKINIAGIGDSSVYGIYDNKGGWANLTRCAFNILASNKKIGGIHFVKVATICCSYPIFAP